MNKFVWLAGILLALTSLVSAQDAKPTVEIRIGQVDTSQFPVVRIYVDIYDSNGQLVTNVDKSALQIKEKDASGKETPLNIDQLYQVFQKEKISFSLMMDKSGSMEGTKIVDSKAAVLNLIGEIAKQNKDAIEVASFDSYVYLNQEFTQDYQAAMLAVKNIQIDARTALYDAIYSALLRVNNQSGARCVIVFTDGMENDSSYTRRDVLKLAALVNVPVYVIGIGGDVAQSDLSDLASQMMGKYYFVDVLNLKSLLSDVYRDIYERQKNRYAITYTVPDGGNLNPRSIEISSKVLGTSSGSDRAYLPKADVNTSFSGTFWNSDFIFPRSSDVRIVDADLRPLSLAELRIARNEIFARHGRQFKDPMLNKWFYSKTWYLKVSPKFSPAVFDAGPYKMNATEKANIEFIAKTEQQRLANQIIFPDASTRLLSEYDVSLTKPVLKRALEEIYQGEGVAAGQKAKLTAIARSNVDLIEASLNSSEVKY